MSDKCLNDEDSGQNPSEREGSENDNRKRGQDPNLSLPPGEYFLVIVFRGRASFSCQGIEFHSSLFYPKRAATAPSDSQLAFPYFPPLDQYNGPQDNQRAVKWVIRRSKLPECYAQERGEEQGFGVCGEEGVVEGKRLAKLVSDDIELMIGNADTELAAGPPLNPGLVEGAIVETTDGFDMRVVAVAWCDAKATLVGARSDIIVNEADTIRRRERRRPDVMGFRRI